MGAAITARPRVLMYNKLHDIRQLSSNISTFCTLYLKNQKGHLEHFVSMIRALSPENTLKRGFAIIRSGNKITSDPDELVIGEDIEILLSGKEITSTIRSKKDFDAREFNL